MLDFPFLSGQSVQELQLHHPTWCGAAEVGTWGSASSHYSSAHQKGSWPLGKDCHPFQNLVLLYFREPCGMKGLGTKVAQVSQQLERLHQGHSAYAVFFFLFLSRTINTFIA